MEIVDTVIGIQFFFPNEYPFNIQYCLFEVKKNSLDSTVGIFAFMDKR